MRRALLDQRVSLVYPGPARLAITTADGGSKDRRLDRWGFGRSGGAF